MPIDVPVSHIGKAGSDVSWGEGLIRVDTIHCEGRQWVHLHVENQLHIYLNADEAAALGEALLAESGTADRT